MKIINIYKIGFILYSALFLFGCAEFEEFESKDLGAGPVVSAELVSAADSVIIIDLTSTADGYIAAAIMPDTGNAVPGDPQVLLQGNVSANQFIYGEAEANVANTFTFTGGVVQNSVYEILYVSSDENGVAGEIQVIEVTTGDAYGPRLVEAVPSISYDPSLAPGGPVLLQFDEPVVAGTGAFSFETFYGGELVEVPADSVQVSGNEVRIGMPFYPDYGDYLWLHWEEDAVADLSGNSVDALTTVFDGDLGAFIGVYWRIMKMEMDVAAVSPDQAAAQDPGFDIVLTFDAAVDAAAQDGFADGDITLVYDDGNGIVTSVDVPAADITVSGADLTIAQNEFAPAGGTVTVVIQEGLLSVGYGNPNTGITVTWDLTAVVI